MKVSDRGEYSYIQGDLIRTKISIFGKCYILMIIKESFFIGYFIKDRNNDFPSPSGTSWLS